MILSLVVGFSFLLKISLIDYEIISDGQTYYNLSLAWASSNSFFIEKSIYLHNLGMPLLHGFVFKITDPSMTLHIVLTISYSCISLVFAYLFLRHYLPVRYSLAGVALLAFNFRLIQNAGFGITEPLFLMLVWGAMYFSIRSRYSFISIPFSTLATLVRFEGIVVIGFVVWQFVASKKYYNILAVFVMMIPLSFTSALSVNRIESSQYDSKILGMIEAHLRHEVLFLLSLDLNSFLLKIANGLVYFGWSLFPEFLLMVPFGFYGIYKKVIPKSIIFWIAIFAGVGIYAYIDAHDTRYFFLSYLLVDLFCLLGLQRFLKQVRK